jgi:hypothetical protein
MAGPGPEFQNKFRNRLPNRLRREVFADSNSGASKNVGIDPGNELDSGDDLADEILVVG